MEQENQSYDWKNGDPGEGWEPIPNLCTLRLLKGQEGASASTANNKSAYSWSASSSYSAFYNWSSRGGDQGIIVYPLPVEDSLMAKVPPPTPPPQHSDVPAVPEYGSSDSMDQDIPAADAVPMEEEEVPSSGGSMTVKATPFSPSSSSLQPPPPPPPTSPQLAIPPSYTSSYNANYNNSYSNPPFSPSSWSSSNKPQSNGYSVNNVSGEEEEMLRFTGEWILFCDFERNAAEWLFGTDPLASRDSHDDKSIFAVSRRRVR